jgi:hypothetical protein
MTGAGPFVLNLCSSSTPMALAQMELPELKRFSFFVSRRFEEGRERFRLHMGHFATLAEAEEWLSVVREIYPGAWAGEAPGRKLRERATAAAAAQAQHAAGPQPPHPSILARTAASSTPPSARALSTVAPAAQMPALRVPVVHAAPPMASRPAPPPPGRPVVARRAGDPAPGAPLVRPGSHAPARPPAAPLAAAPPAPMKPAVPVKAAVPVKVAIPLRAAVPVKIPAPVARATPAIPPAQRTASAPVARAALPVARPAPKPVFEDSNVREVLKALGDSSATGETRLMQAPPPLPMAARAVSVSTTNPASSLSDTQVLKLLETRRSEENQPVPTEITEGNIPLLKPDDTGTRRALKEAVANNAPVAFAVQLQWSVQPAELDNVPPLAIFSAYTLYTVEGSRDGRKWYGLRLGFFSDAISAKQVAHYVRSEFGSVAVVPVSPQEKARATDQEIAAATFVAPVATRRDPLDEFKLIDEAGAARPPLAPAAQKTQAKPMPKVAVGRMVRQPPGRPRVAGKVGAREQRSKHTLEETLEILGAGQLSIDTGNGETLNDSGVRHLRVEVQKNSPFSRLLERLSEKMRKPQPGR